MIAKVLAVDPTAPPKIFKAVGCDKCNNIGYKGRIAINEIMAIDKGMDELIATHATRNKMLDHAMSKGFVPIIQDATQKVLQGIMDIPEMVRTVDVTERL